MKPQPIDPLFRVELISATHDPQLTAFAAMRQDYIEEFAWDRFSWLPNSGFCFDEKTEQRIDEPEAGRLLIKNLLAGNRGHFGPLEHPQIVLNFGHFPHSVMQQLRTHRIGVSFDVQSFRYSGNRLVEVANKLSCRDSFAESDLDTINEVIYLRPVGTYTDRQGKRYDYTKQRRQKHLWQCMNALEQYADDIAYGMSEEHARGMIPFDVRQSWVMSMNLRSLMAIMLIRGKADAQLEIQQLCQLTLPYFQAWCPEIFAWFMENLWQKGRLSP